MINLFKRKAKQHTRLIDNFCCVGKFPVHVEFIKLGHCIDSLQQYDQLVARCHEERLRTKTMQQAVRIEAMSFNQHTIELHHLASSQDTTARSYPFLIEATSQLSLALESIQLSLLAYLPFFEGICQLSHQVRNAKGVANLTELSRWFNQFCLSESSLTRAMLFEQALICFKSAKVTDLFQLKPDKFTYSNESSDYNFSDSVRCWYPRKASRASLISYLHVMMSNSSTILGQSLVWRYLDEKIDSVYAIDSQLFNSLLIALYNHPSLTTSKLASQLKNQTEFIAPELTPQSTLYEWINNIPLR